MEERTQTGLLSISAFVVKTLMKELHEFRTNYGTDVKLRPLYKFDKRDTVISEKIDVDLIVGFSILGQCKATQKQGSMNNYLLPKKS